MDKPILRAFLEQDWPNMVRFYEQFYGPRYIFTDRKFFNWNFFSPLRDKKEASQYLLLDGQKIIGIMGSLIWPLRFGSKKILGEYNINLMINPDYRGRNWGQTLLEKVSEGYSHSLTSGYHPKTLTIYERVGKVYHWNMKRFTKCLSEEKTKNLLSASPSFAGLETQEQHRILTNLKKSTKSSSKNQPDQTEKVGRFNAEWDEAWAGISGNYGCTTDRSSTFLNWRYIDYPFPIYECSVFKRKNHIVGLLALRIERTSVGNIARVVDLVALDDEVLRALLEAASDQAVQYDCLFVDYIASGKLEIQVLEQAGYLEFTDSGNNSHLPMDFFPLRYRNSIETLIMFLNRDDETSNFFDGNNFYITKGDGDQDRAN